VYSFTPVIASAAAGPEMYRILFWAACSASAVAMPDAAVPARIW
jgi:hypothetical protein